MMREALRALRPVRIALYGVGIWVIRVILVAPFVESGRLPVLAEEVAAEGDRLPIDAEYFFSLLILGFVAATLFATYRLFRATGSENAVAKGAVMSAGFLVAVAVPDLVLSATVADRTLGEFLTNVALDYSPVILIPIGVGVVLDSTREPTPT